MNNDVIFLELNELFSVSYEPLLITHRQKETMSASLSTQDFSHTSPLIVSFRWLLSLYAIVPVCVLLQLMDQWFWQGALREHLPSSPKQFLLFQIIFGTPHIIASTVVLVSHPDYLKHYQRKVMAMTIGLALFFGIGSLFMPYRALYVIVAAWTVYHVLKQQHGVARGVCRLPNPAFYGLLWLSVIAGLVIYLGIFLKDGLSFQEANTLKTVAGALCGLLIVTAVFCQRYTSTPLGNYFLWANVLLVLSSYYLYLQQYYFLAILAPRLVHDATAYIFYVTHDYNRHHDQPQNSLYRATAYCHVPIILVLPLVSFSLAFMLQSYGDGVIRFLTHWLFGIEINKVITVGLLGYLALMHYYTEAFTWKQDSPYRRFIHFK